MHSAGGSSLSARRNAWKWDFITGALNLATSFGNKPSILTSFIVETSDRRRHCCNPFYSCPTLPDMKHFPGTSFTSLATFYGERPPSLTFGVTRAACSLPGVTFRRAADPSTMTCSFPSFTVISKMVGASLEIAHILAICMTSCLYSGGQRPTRSALTTISPRPTAQSSFDIHQTFFVQVLTKFFLYIGHLVFSTGCYEVGVTSSPKLHKEVPGTLLQLTHWKTSKIHNTANPSHGDTTSGHL